MEFRKISIKFISFLGNSVKPAMVEFKSGLNLIYGASNTGKSFVLKAIDFMFGGRDPLPDISERIGYDSVLLGFTIEDIGDFTLLRSVNGGDYKLYNSFIYEISEDTDTIQLALTPTKKIQSLSQFLLGNLGFSDKKLAKNVSGITENISIRDFATLFLVNERTIQSEKSPVEGDLGPLKSTRERSFFRMLLTGKDDSSIIKIIDNKTYKISKDARIDVLNDLIASMNHKLVESYPEVKDLPDQDQKLSATLSTINMSYNEIDDSIRNLISEKKTLLAKAEKLSENISEITNHINRFMQLDNVYESDINRLKAIEEAGFVFTLSMNRNCDLCGAPPEAQIHKKGLEDIERSRIAAVAEIQKIKALKSELSITLEELRIDKVNIEKELAEVASQVHKIDGPIKEKQQKLDDTRKSLLEIIDIRDSVQQGISLLNQRNELYQKLEEIENTKNETPNNKPSLKAPDDTIFKFCQKVSTVLKAWNFPGECMVSFDEKAFDIIIDGKLRIYNGKGVRAITHSAFKVALLIYCRENQLPHPGLLVLDSPLVTYRDPMKDKKNGALSEDELIIAKTSLKESFLKHLSSLSDLGQVIILENVDPPNDVENYSHVEVFYGDVKSGRRGFF